MTEIQQGQIWQNKTNPEEKVFVVKVTPNIVHFRDSISGDGYFYNKMIFRDMYRLAKVWQVNAKSNPLIAGYPGTRNEQGQKHDQAKPRFSLIPHQALWQVVAVLEFGAKKYGAGNWRGVENARDRYFNACHRHLNAWWQGESVDDESGLPHLAHAVCCLLFMMSLGESNDK